MQAAVQSYLLASIAGGSMDVDELLNGARCLTSCLPPGLLFEVKTHLLCQIVENTSPVTPEPECDQDALDFIAAANLTDPEKQDAICFLVRQLKLLPAVGTKYWDRDILIYPFVSNSADNQAQRAASHAVNLKNPGGANDITWNGGIIHSDIGVQGDNLGYGNTNYIYGAGMQNSIRMMMYLDLEMTLNTRWHYGCSNVGGSIRYGMRTNVPARYDTSENQASTTNCGIFQQKGAIFSQRYDGATKWAAGPTNPNWVGIAVGSVGVPGFPIYLFAYNGGGALSLQSDGRWSSWTFGDPLDVGGGNAERLEYKWIWDEFNLRLGRSHPLGV
jgi:hypothetical protein